MLNIFYNRDAEIKMLEEMAAEEERLIEQNDGNSYEVWLKEKIAAFRMFLHDQEMSRRRKEKNLEHHEHYKQDLAEDMGLCLDEFYHTF